jgi:hypothetical protein
MGLRVGRQRTHPHVRLGRYVRFERDQIDLWLNQLRNDGRSYFPREVVLANIR